MELTDLQAPPSMASTVNIAEDFAYKIYRRAQDMAFKLEGIRGVLQLGHYSMQEADKLAWASGIEGPDDSAMTAAICGHLGSTYLPKMMNSFSKAIKVLEKPTETH